ISMLQILPQGQRGSSLRNETLLRKLETLRRTTRPALGNHTIINHTPTPPKVMIHRLQLTTTMTLSLQHGRVGSLYLSKMLLAMLPTHEKSSWDRVNLKKCSFPRTREF